MLPKSYFKKYIDVAVCLIIISIFVFRLLNSLFYMELTRFKTAPDAGSVLYTDNDNMAWILSTKEAIDNKLWRIHRVHWDGGVEGRDHHWSSPMVWGLMATQAIVQPITQESTLHSIETSVPIFYTILCIVCTLLVYLIAKLVYKEMAIAFVCFFLVSTYSKWEALNIDHHFLLMTFGSIFLLSLIGVIKYKTNKYYILAGIVLGLGFWISAINTLPLLIACLVAGLALDAYTKNLQSEINFTSRGLMYLGLTSSVISALAVLIEYFPTTILRLEVNNYIYSISLLTGFAILAAFKQSKYILSGVLTFGLLIIGGFTLLLPNIKYGETTSRLLLYISECQPLPLVEGLGWVALALAIIVYIIPKDKFVNILFPLIVTIFGALFTFASIRNVWLFFIPASCTILSGYNYIADIKLKRTVVFSTLFLITFPLVQSEINRARKGDLSSIERANKSRNLGIAINKNNKHAVIMSDPSSSPALAYYSGGTCIAGIYWEAEDNIAQIAKAYTTEDHNEFLSILDELKPTTIVIFDDTIILQHISNGRKGLLENSNSVVSKIKSDKIKLGKEIPNTYKIKMYNYQPNVKSTVN